MQLSRTLLGKKLQVSIRYLKQIDFSLYIPTAISRRILINIIWLYNMFIRFLSLVLASYLILEICYISSLEYKSTNLSG